MSLDDLLAEARKFNGVPARHGKEIARALLRGDEPMDELVAWMAREGIGKGRALFEQALEHGGEDCGGILYIISPKGREDESF
ncbi:MAG TPA: hypothetical protein VG891_11135 [Rhizomicrobium sp.]|nr:hypothetical protein [Rhizomicrobium sp.]